MRNISSKTDNVGDTLPASDFNANLRVELQTLVTDTGQSLDPEGGPDTDLDMIGKAIAMYSNGAQYYADTGSADTYEVDRVGNLQPLTSYIDGVTVMFKAANTNTGASTIDVDGLGVKDLVDSSGSALTAGAVLAGQYITARYNSSTDDFELVTSSSSSLTTWENIGDDLRPVVSGTGTLGDTSHFVESLYLGDDNRVYFGDSQDMSLWHSGASGALAVANGYLTVVTGTAQSIYFATNNVNRWYVATTGGIYPYVNNAYNIGTASLRVMTVYGVDGNFSNDVTVGDNIYCTSGNIYFNDGYSATFGTGNDGYIAFNGTQLIINCVDSISFRISGSQRWSISSVSGAFLPSGTGNYDIGAGTNEVDDIYCVTLHESSDIRSKTNIVPSFLGLDFINNLNPIAYHIYDKKDKLKHGLSAQHVLEVIEKLGYNLNDFGAISNDDDKWSLNYSQFIGPIINAIKELSRRIDDQVKQH